MVFINVNVTGFNDNIDSMSFFKHKDMSSSHAVHGQHFSGYYVKPSKTASRSAHGNGNVIIDVDPVVYYESIDRATNKKNSYSNNVNKHEFILFKIFDDLTGKNKQSEHDDIDVYSSSVKSIKNSPYKGGYHISDDVYGLHVDRSLKARLTGFVKYDIPMFIPCIAIGVVISLSTLMFYGFYNIPSASMETTLMTGDRVMASKMWLHDYNVHRGDIIIFKDPGGWLDGSKAGQELCKRVIGLPGDTVSTDENGNILVNNKKLNEPYLQKGLMGSDIQFSVKVTDGNVFVLGDNRTNSADSRYHVDDGNHGLVPIKNITNIVDIRYWPFNKIDFNMHDNVSK